MSTNQLVLIVLLAAVVAVYFLPLLAVGWSARREARALLATGLDGEAEIVGYKSIRGQWVQYKFTPAGSNQEVVCSKCLFHGGKLLPVGSKTPVKYKASHPQISLLVIYAHSQMPS